MTTSIATSKETVVDLPSSYPWDKYNLTDSSV